MLSPIPTFILRFAQEESRDPCFHEPIRSPILAYSSIPWDEFSRRSGLRVTLPSSNKVRTEEPPNEKYPNSSPLPTVRGRSAVKETEPTQVAPNEKLSDSTSILRVHKRKKALVLPKDGNFFS